ncbi:unnamed protein product [Sphenostylis stenocarpa]|uniref:Uncharacterized protein n=1 Tax=Sphenostylis stenocarpa TaxID=92480 RepID=A0AA86SR95_9FABA|nr:unnamed protein product [Sphenostylis stenocarpa]
MREKEDANETPNDTQMQLKLRVDPTIIGRSITLYEAQRAVPLSRALLSCDSLHYLRATPLSFSFFLL